MAIDRDKAHERVLTAAISANIPVFMQGDPGIGKTKYLGAYAEATSRHFEVVTGTVIERADVAGYPVHDETTGTMEYSPLGWAKRLSEAKKGLLLLGEFNLSENDVQKAFMRVLQERMVGTQALPDSVSIVLDGNFTEGSAGAFDLPAPVANRILHLPWTFEPDQWLTGVLDDFASTHEKFDDTIAPTVAHAAQERSLLLGFLDSHRLIIHSMPKTALERSGAWPSARSWTNAMSVMPHLREDDADAQHLALSGLVGRRAADTYMQWRATSSKYPIRDLVTNPGSLEWRSLPPGQLLAVVSTLTEWALGHGTLKAWKAAVESITVIAEASGKKDVAIRGLERLLSRAPKGAALPRRTRDTFTHLLRASGAWTNQEDTDA